MTKLRVHFKYDNDPDYSFLEQWDTPERYYGVDFRCRHGTEMDYDKAGVFRSDRCDECQDEDRTEHNTTPPKGTDNGGVILRDGTPIPFEEYIKYEGNIDRHVMLVAIVEKFCPHCQTWSAAGHSLGGIDFMDTDKFEVNVIYKESELDQIPFQQREVAQDLFAEAHAEDDDSK